MSEEQNSDVGGIAADRLRSLIERIDGQFTDTRPAENRFHNH